MKLVLVEWKDSATTTGWHTLNPKVEGICACISVGILHYENEEEVQLYQSGSNSGNRSEVMAIPKCSIKRIRTLKVVPNGKDNSLGALV